MLTPDVGYNYNVILTLNVRHKLMVTLIVRYD